MFKPQMKFQKILFPVLIALSGVVFVYSLGIMTDMYGLYQTQALGGVTGSQIVYDMQEYNHNMILISIALILISALPFVFASNTRRKYYKGNVISTYVQAAALVLAAVYMIINSLKYRSQFLNTVDFEMYKMMSETMNFMYSESTFFFDAGIIIAVLLLVGAGAVVYNLNWKNKLVKQEDAILKGEANNG
jgi:hypothetical protein